MNVVLVCSWCVSLFWVRCWALKDFGSYSGNGSCDNGTQCGEEREEQPPCQPGFYCPDGGSAPVPCPKGTFGWSVGAKDAGSCEKCPAHHFSPRPGMPACLPCGTWAEQPNPGQDTCVCPGEGQAFQASDGQCPCSLGYKPVGEGSGLCVRRVYEICRDGTARSQEGVCLDREQWAQLCTQQVCSSPSDYQGYNKALGLCLCRTPDLSAVCDGQCRRRQRQAIQLTCTGTLKLHISSSKTKVKMSANALDKVLSSWDFLNTLHCTRHFNYTRPVYLVETNKAGFIGVLNAEPREVQRLFGKTRQEPSSLKESSDVFGNVTFYNETTDDDGSHWPRNAGVAEPASMFTGILNPTVCLSLGDILLFTVLKEHYPQYDIDNLYNTNANFDWGAFRSLAEDMTLAPTPARLFSLSFPEAGVYVLKLNSNRYKRMYIKVMPVGGQCYEVGPFFPTVPRHIIRMGMARSRHLLLQPDWPVIVGLLVGSALILSVCITLLILFREHGWSEKTPISPRYRKLQLKYNLDDYSSRGSTVVAVKKYHRSLQMHEPDPGGQTQTVAALTADDFWDYEQQIDLEAFDTHVFYDILLKHTIAVTTRLGQLKEEAKELYGKVAGRAEWLGALWVSRLTETGGRVGARDGVKELYQRKHREVEEERVRRRGLAAELGCLLDRQLQTLQEELVVRQERQGAFGGQLREALRLLDQLSAAVASQHGTHWEQQQQQLAAQRLDSLIALMSEDVTRECQRLGAWAVLGEGTGGHLLSPGRGQVLTREELIAPDGTVRAFDAIHIDACTGLIIPNRGTQMLLASGLTIPVPSDFFVHPQTGRVLPVAGNVGYDPGRSRLVFTADSCSGEAGKWDVPLLPFVPYPVSRRTGLPVKTRLRGLGSGQKMAFGGPMCDPITGVLVPILAVTIHPETGLVYPLGGTHTCPFTHLPCAIQIGRAMLELRTGRVMLTVGVSLDPKTGDVIPVGGLISPSSVPLLLGSSFTEPLSGRPVRVGGATLKTGKLVPHAGGYQALLDAQTLACRLRVTELLRECREGLSTGLPPPGDCVPGERDPLSIVAEEMQHACKRSQHSLLQLICGLERQREQARTLVTDGGCQGVMKFPGTALSLPALPGVEYPDPEGSGLLIPVLGAQFNWDSGCLVPVAGTMEDADGKGLVPIRIGARTVDPVTRTVGAVVGARLDPLRKTVVPITQSYKQFLRGIPDQELVDVLQEEATLRSNYWRCQRQKEEELLRDLHGALQHCLHTAALGQVEKAHWIDSVRNIQVTATELQEAAQTEAHRQETETSELSQVLPPDVFSILNKGDEEELEQQRRVQAVLGAMLHKVSATVDRLQQEQDRLMGQASALQHSKAWGLGVRELWEQLLARQRGLEEAVSALHCHRELCQLRVTTAEAVVSGSFWYGDYDVIQNRTYRNPQRAIEMNQRQAVPLLQRLIRLMEENKQLRLSPTASSWPGSGVSVKQPCVSNKGALEICSRAWTASVPAVTGQLSSPGTPAVSLKDTEKALFQKSSSRDARVSLKPADQLHSFHLLKDPTQSQYVCVPTLTEVEWDALLDRSPLFQLLQKVDQQLRARARAAGLLEQEHDTATEPQAKGQRGPEGEQNATIGEGRPFLDLLDAQWRCEGELTALSPDRLGPREFVIYQHGLYLLRFLHTHTQVPEVTLLVATTLPSNNYSHNPFRHSFFYQEAQRTLFVRRQRLQSVGSFSLLLLHCLSHIATGELRHDSSPVFQRFFFQSVQACLNELFLLRLDGYGDAPSVRALRGALAGEASSGPATLSALSTLLQDRVQEPTLACLSEKRACEQLQKYREASIYRSVEGLLRERSVGVRKDYHRQAPLSAGSRSSSHTGSNPVDTLADSKEQSQASLGWLNRELSGLLSAEWQKGTMGVIPKEILLRDIERLERECGLGGE